LNANEREKSVILGRDLVEKELRKFRLSPREILDAGKATEVLKKLGFAALEDLFAAVGYGKVMPRSLVVALLPDVELKPKAEGVVARVVKRALGLGERRVKVRGLDDMMIILARCCNPVRGEEIVGYITRGKGVAVHSVQCPNVRSLMFDPERRIDVEWDSDSASGSLFDVKLSLDVSDRQGLLAKIVAVVADEEANIRNVEAKTFEGSDARVTIVMAVADRQQMERVIARVRKIDGVRDVARISR
jgi:GTP pyrophosphokinase